MLGSAGLPASASVGGSPRPKRQPLHIGLSGLPASNSTHTPAPGGGTMYVPIGTPVGPASGVHASHHDDGVGPSTSGTIHIKRPRSSGSTLFTTVPRYLP